MSILESTIAIHLEQTTGSAVKVRLGGADRIVTCLHNLEAAAPMEGNRLALYCLSCVCFGSGRWICPITCNVISMDIQNDLAILTCPAELQHLPSAEIAQQAPLTGDFLRGYGYAYDESNWKSEEQPFPGVIARQIDGYHSQNQNFLLCSGGGSNHGMSGGAVVNSSEKLVGFLKGTTYEEPPRTMVVLVEPILP